MGRRGQRNAQAKKAGSDPVLEAALAAGSSGMFRPLPPKKRHELNKVVERLLHLTSNFTQDAPSTPQALAAEHKEVRALVEQVRQAETCNLNRPIVGPRRAHAHALGEWLAKMGGEMTGLQVKDYGEEGLGLECTSDLKEGDVVLRVPRRAMMSVDTARDSEIGRLIESDPMLKAMGNVSLSLHLLLEKTSPASFWEPYINSLPQSYTTVLYFTQEEMDELKGSPAHEDALKQYKYVARQYAYFYRKFEGTMIKDYFTFDEYRWAVSTVMTRQNQVPSDREEGAFVNALVPFWDLANHRAGGQLSTDYEDEEEAKKEEEGVEEEGEEGETKRPVGGRKGFLKCMANGAFSKGDEFTIYYGKRGNHDLLVHNGFCLPDNPDDFLAVRLGVGKNDLLAQGKHALLEALAISPHGHFALRRNQDKLDPVLLAFLRVLCLKTEEEVKGWKGEEGSGDPTERTRGLLQPETSGELDDRAYQYLSTRCALLLRSYPTTLEEDARRRKEEGEKLSQVARFCLDLRMGEKQVLVDTVDLCKKKLAK